MNQQILVLSPHPDDESIGCGGTLRKHVLEGDIVRVVFLTSGEAGGHNLPPSMVAEIREAEAQQAREILGLAMVEFWHEPDGMLRATKSLIARLRAAINEYRPNLVYVPHAGEMHPDHRAAAQLVQLALFDMQPCSVTVRMFEVWTPLQTMDDIVDISKYMTTKLQAVRAYRSQCDVLSFDDAIAGLNRYRGEMHSWPGGDYAEVFQRMRIT